MDRESLFHLENNACSVLISFFLQCERENRKLP